MKKGDATRERIIREAVEQTSVRGLTAVSLGDVAFAVGLSKSGLFKHFDSKEVMQQAVLEAVLARYREVLLDGAEDLPPGRARLERLFDNWLTWMDNACARGGCVLIAATIELDDQPGPLRDEVRRGLIALRRTLVDTVAKAVEAGDLRPDTDPEQFAFELEGIYQVAQQSRRLLNDPDADRRALFAFDRLVRDYAVERDKE